MEEGEVRESEGTCHPPETCRHWHGNSNIRVQITPTIQHNHDVQHTNKILNMAER